MYFAALHAEDPVEQAWLVLTGTQHVVLVHVPFGHALPPANTWLLPQVDALKWPLAQVCKHTNKKLDSYTLCKHNSTQSKIFQQCSPH